MKKIIKELKLIINNELYKKKIISFEEFKLINENIIKDDIDECSSN
jgi:predicted HTH domain antitoxin